MPNWDRRPVYVDWLGVSSELFTTLKRAFNIGDSWTFDLRDQVLEDPSELEDLQGAVAFTLRRLQAINFLLRGSDTDQLSLLVGYAADVEQFLNSLVASGRLSNEDDQALATRANTIALALVVAATDETLFA